MRNLRKVMSTILCMLLLWQTMSVMGYAQDKLPVTVTPLEETEQSGGTGIFTYLSDIETSEMVRCNVGWGSYTVDKNLDGNPITLKNSQGGVTTYKKGVVAHADADLIYDLGESYNEYDTFTASVGVDASRGSKGSVYFTFMVSNTPSDNSSWQTKSTSASGVLMRGNTVKKDISININGYRYFRIVIGKDANNEADHSVIANASFSSQDYVAPTVNCLKATVETSEGTTTADMNEAFFEGLMATYLQYFTYNEIIENPETELNVLRYDLVKKCGYDNLLLFLTTSDKYKERAKMFRWLFNDVDNMREFMNGGEPANGSYVGALRILSDLYNTYTEDLSDQTPLRLGDDKTETRKDLYRRMMFCMALVCSGGLQPWMANTAKAVPVNRYAYYKENYVNNKMRDEIFENLNIEEMRWVLGNNISDSEIVWLNDYSVIKQKYSTFPGKYSPHHLISYQWYDYSKDKFYSSENEQYYNQKYYLKYTDKNGNLVDYSKYGLTYGLVNGVKVQRVWMVFEDGAVCGNISRTGANLASCWGVPACESGQPGHCAFLIMNRNAQGNFTWGIDNNISGWLQTDNGRRMPCDWGTWNDKNAWINGGYRASYIFISQAALDDYDNYCKAEEVLKLYGLCSTNEEKEACLRAALSFQSFNLDAWVALIKLYTADSAKTVHQLADLGTELCSTPMVYYPRTLNDLMQMLINRLNVIKNNTPSGTQKEEAETEYVATVMRRQSAFYKAAAATTANCTQPDVAKYLANSYLSGDTQAFATFSFDGSDAGKLVFNSSFTSVRFYMCFSYTNDDNDSNDTWLERTVAAPDETGRVVYTLTEEELSQITAEGNIVIRPCGLPESPKNHFTIDITQAGDLVDNYSVTGMYMNDNENRFLGNVSGKEYSLDMLTWNNLTNDVVFEGDTDVYVRYKTSGTMLAGKNATKFSFTDNNEDEHFSYISIKRESLVDFSSQEASKNDYASFAIDGIPYTRWHSGWWTNDTQRYVTIKLSEPTYFSGISYLAPDTSGPNGTYYGCDVYVSIDGNNWYKASSGSFASTNDVQVMKFSSVAYGQYIKLVGARTHGNYAAAREFSLYEDKTFIGRVPETLTITSLPTKTDYAKGERLDLTGIKAVCTFDNKSTLSIPALMLTADTDVFNTSGLNTVHVQYLDLTPTAFVVNVTNNTYSPTALSLEASQFKTEYYIGEKFEDDGLTVYATNGTNTWATEEKDVTLSVSGADENKIFTALGEQTVTVGYKGISKPITINVKALPQITVEQAPDKTTYNLGDSFDPEGMIVKITENGETRVLPYGNYVVDEDEAEAFSKTSGTEKTLTIYLNGHRNVQTQVTGLTVYDYIVFGNFRFEIDGDGSHECTLTQYSGTDEAVVNVPSCVYVNGICYDVVKIGGEAFQTAEDVLQLILPDTLLSIEDGAFSGLESIMALTLPGTAITASPDEIGTLTSLQKLSITGFDIALDSESFEGLTSLTNIELSDVASSENVEIASAVLPENVVGKIFVKNTSLAEALNAKFSAEVLNDYTFAVINREGTVFTISAPEKTEYTLGENLSTEGFNAILQNSDGTVEAVMPGDCTFSPTTLDRLGDEVKITVTHTETGFTDTFNVKVNSVAPVFTANLPDTAFTQTPLTVSATVNAGQVAYKWYYSSDTSYTEDDELCECTTDTFTITKEGYYYVVAVQRDVYGNTGKSKRSFVTHSVDPNRIKNTTSNEYFTTLAQAFQNVQNGETLELLYDVYADSQAVLSTNQGTKAVTVTSASGKKCSVIRTYEGSVITVNSGCTLNLDGITVDGGAVWSGTPDKQLGRGTQNNGITATAPLINLNANAKLNLNNNTVIRNVSAKGETMYGSVIRLTSDADSNTALTINLATIENCHSPSNNLPGSVFIARYGKITVKDGLFKGNSNTIFYNVSGSASPIDIQGGTFINNSGTNGTIVQMGGPATLNISGGTFKNNKSTNGTVVYAWNGGTVNISAGTFEDNTAIKGGVYGLRDGYGSPVLKITGGIFKNNKATNEGGVIYYNRDNFCEISNAEFTGNSSDTNGGAIFYSTGVTIKNCKFENNTAKNLGGSIYIGNAFDSGFALTLVSAESLGEVCIDSNRQIKLNCSALAVLGKLNENGSYVFDGEKASIVKKPGNTQAYRITYVHDSDVLTAVTDEKIDATCVETGLTEGSHCGVCGKVITAQTVISTQGSHSFGQWNEQVPAQDCKTPGTKGYYYCSVCKKYYDSEEKEITDITLTAPHNLGAWQEETQPADCTTDGHIGYYYCSVCQKYFDSEQKEITDVTIPASHSYGAWHEEIPAQSCKAPGTKAHYECSVCNRYFDISKNELTDITLTAQHSWDAGKVITTPTCVSKGSIEYTCTVCGDKQKNEIPTGNHVDTNKDGVCEVCGDNYCTCNCHKSGFLGFLWKIGNFFNKIFKIKRVCDCGREHY